MGIRGGCPPGSSPTDGSPPHDDALFGSDYPVITPDRWMRDFDNLDIRDEVRPLILKDNAIRALGL